MPSYANFFKLLTDSQIEKLHENTLSLLNNPGMKIENAQMLKALQKKGALVDFTAEIVRFPSKMIEEVIEIAAKEEKTRISAIAVKSDYSSVKETDYPNMLTFSWHTPFKNRNPKVQASFGGGAPCIMTIKWHKIVMQQEMMYCE